MKLSDIAARLECELHGDRDIDVTGLQPVDEAGPHDLTFVSNRKYFAKLPDTRAAAVILPIDAPPMWPGDPSSRTRVRARERSHLMLPSCVMMRNS